MGNKQYQSPLGSQKMKLVYLEDCLKENML